MSSPFSCLGLRAGLGTSGTHAFLRSDKCTARPQRGSKDAAHNSAMEDLMKGPRTVRPRRVQLRRTRGWRMPANTVKVDRTTRFGNPFSIEGYGRERAVALHRAWITGEVGNPPIPNKLLRDLRRGERRWFRGCQVCGAKTLPVGVRCLSLASPTSVTRPCCWSSRTASTAAIAFL